MSGEWFFTKTARPQAPVRLYCLPHAGGGSAVYGAWAAALGDAVEVRAVMLPGRERRLAEPPSVDPDALAAAVMRDADRPFALFGHSMGARLGFEVVRRLRGAGGPLPCRLFVSGAPAPDLPLGGRRYDGLSTLGDRELIAALAAGGGLSEAVLGSRELLDLLLPAMRADVTWLDTYQYREQEALPVPLTAFVGTDDDAAPADSAAGWRRHTAAAFTLHMVPGGHFFVHEQLSTVAAVVRAELAALPALSTGGRP